MSACGTYPSTSSKSCAERHSDSWSRKDTARSRCPKMFSGPNTYWPSNGSSPSLLLQHIRSLTYWYNKGRMKRLCGSVCPKWIHVLITYSLRLRLLGQHMTKQNATTWVAPSAATRMVSSAGRTSDSDSEGRGFDSYSHNYTNNKHNQEWDNHNWLCLFFINII